MVLHDPALRPRLRSLDALRGFDMLWIIGGASLVAAVAPLADRPWLSWLDEQTGEHVAWHGFVLWDLVFPLFLFISGVTLPFSFGARARAGASRGRLALVALRRGLVLVLLGCIYNGLLRLDWETMRYPSVLGRIGLAWMAAAWIWLVTGTRGRVLWTVGLLLGYWAALALIPVPGAAAGDLSLEGNLASWIDRQLLPGRLHRGIHDPEGLFSTVPAIATALLGVLTGEWLQSARREAAKVLGMLAAGAVALGLGYLWNEVFPINKNLWTSSFALWCAGWSLGLLALFYLVIDVWGLAVWSLPLVVIGLNPLTIYLLQDKLVDFELPARFLFGGILDLLSPAEARAGFEALVLLAKWTLLWLLYRQRLFLKV